MNYCSVQQSSHLATKSTANSTINKSWSLVSFYTTFINDTVTPNCAFFKTPSHFLWNMFKRNATTARGVRVRPLIASLQKTKRCKTANALRDKSNLAVSAVFILDGERAKQMSDFWQADVDVWSSVDEPPTMRWIGKIVTSWADVIYPAISERILGGLTGIGLTGRVPGRAGPDFTLCHFLIIHVDHKWWRLLNSNSFSYCRYTFWLSKMIFSFLRQRKWTK